jgi:hypothetical protein
MNISKNGFIGTILGAILFGAMLCCHLTPSSPRYIVNVTNKQLPEVDWAKPKEITESTNLLTISGPRATLWFSVFDIADRTTAADNAAIAADAAVKKVFSKPPYQERAIIWLSVFKRADQDTLWNISVECANHALDASLP